MEDLVKYEFRIRRLGETEFDDDRIYERKRGISELVVVKDDF